MQGKGARMEKVFIYNDLLGLKGTPGILHESNANGYYVVVIKIKEKRHRALLPISTTTLIYCEPVVEIDSTLELE